MAWWPGLGHYFLTIWMTSSCSMVWVRPTRCGLYLVLVPWVGNRAEGLSVSVLTKARSDGLGQYGRKVGRGECWSLKWEIPALANTRGVRQQDSLWSDRLWILKMERPVSSLGQQEHCVQWDRHTGIVVPLWRAGTVSGTARAHLPPTHPHQRVLELAGERPVDAVALVGGQERQTVRRGPTQAHQVPGACQEAAIPKAGAPAALALAQEPHMLRAQP